MQIKEHLQFTIDDVSSVVFNLERAIEAFVGANSLELTGLGSES